MLSIFQNLVRLFKTDVGDLLLPKRSTSPENTDTPAIARQFPDQLPAAQTYQDKVTPENMDSAATGRPSPDESPEHPTNQDRVSLDNRDTFAVGSQSLDEIPTPGINESSTSEDTNPTGVNPMVSLSLENKGNTVVRVTLPTQSKVVSLKASPSTEQAESTLLPQESQTQESDQSLDAVLEANEQKDRAFQENMDTPAVGKQPPVSSPEPQNPMDKTVIVKESVPNSPEAQKAIAMRYYEEILNNANLATIDELMSPDFLFTIPTHPDPYRGPEGFKDLIRMLHGAFPDVHLKVEHLLVDGYTVVGHWTGSGTHTGGPLHTVKGDIPATGKRFVIDGVSWLKIVDGKIVESLANEDTLSLLRQVGVLPPAREATKGIVRSYFNEVLNQGNFDRLNEIVAPEVVMHEPMLLEPVSGVEALKNYVAALRAGFPNIRYNVERETADQEMGAIRWTMSGTHQGDFFGTPPTGKSVNLQGVNIFRLREGQIVEIWVNENALGLLEQIRALP